MTEGLGGLIGRVVELDLHNGFRIEASDLIVSHLQYVDDTFILAKFSIDNF